MKPIIAPIVEGMIAYTIHVTDFGSGFLRVDEGMILAEVRAATGTGGRAAAECTLEVGARFRHSALSFAGASSLRAQLFGELVGIRGVLVRLFAEFVSS
jgi:hypothetical protein